MTFLCRQAEQSQDSILRDRYYASHIEHLQALWNELDKGRRHDFEQSPLPERYVQLHAFPENAQGFYAEPPSATSDMSASSGSTLASKSTPVTPASTNTSSQSTLQTSSSNSSSPSNTPSSLSSLGQLQRYTGATAQFVTRCYICDQPFRGTLQNRMCNVRRHLRHTHHQGEQMACSEPGCDKTFGRSDNLRIHRQKAHNIDDRIVRSGSKRQRRLSKEKARVQVNYL